MLQKKKIFSTAFMIMLIYSTFAFADTLSPKVRISTLSSVPIGYEIVGASIKMSNNAKNIAFIAYTDNTHKKVLINNQAGPVYYAVNSETPIWSPDSKTCAYIAYKNKEEGVLAINHSVVATFENANNLIFSENGSRYACRAIKNNYQFVVMDGKAGKSYDGILIKDNFSFSPDSKRFIYVAVKDGACVAVIDGQEESQSFNFIEGVRFSPDSNHYAYRARTQHATLAGGDKWCVVKDGKPGKIYDQIFDIFFSLDSKHLAYTAIKDKKMILVFDDYEMGPHDRVGLPVFSPDSKTFAYAYADIKKAKWYILLNDKSFGPFDSLHKFYFSPDSKKFAFIAIEEKKWFCNVDGKPEPHIYNFVEEFQFSKDSSRYLYAGVEDDGARLIIDGKPGKKYRSIGEPYFSPDSKHVVYRALHPNEDKWITVFDGKESSKKYFGISPYHFSYSSNHLAYAALVNVNKSVMVVDGIEHCSGQNFKILGDPQFSPFGDFIVYYVMAGEQKWKLIVTGHTLPETYGGFIKGTPIIFDSPNHFYTIGIKTGGTEFVLIDVEIPDTFKLTSGLNSL